MDLNLDIAVSGVKGPAREETQPEENEHTNPTPSSEESEAVSQKRPAPAPKTPPIIKLLDRLEAWLLQQPEYPLLFLADRKARRRAAQLIAKRLLTLPTR